MRSLQADLDNARSKLILVGVHPDHEKIQRQEREIERLRAVEEEAHRLRSYVPTRRNVLSRPYAPAGRLSTLESCSFNC